MTHNEKQKSIEELAAISGLPPDLSSGETLTPWECEQRVAQARNAVLDEIERRVGDPWALERGEWDRILKDMRDD